MTTSEHDGRAFARLKLYNFFSYGTIALVFAFFPLYFAEQGLTMIEIGMILSAGPLVSLFANPFWGYVSDRSRNVRRSIAVLLVGNVLVVQFALQATSFAWIYAFMLLFFFFQSPMNSQGNSLILDAIEGTDRKFGSFRLWGSLGYSLVALAAGPIVATAGVERLWIVYTAMMLLAIALTFGLPQGSGGGSATASFSFAGYGRVFRNRTFSAFLLLGVLVAVPNFANTMFISLYVQELGGSEVAVGAASFLSAFFEIFVFLALDRFVRKEPRFIMTCLVGVCLLYVLRWTLMSLSTEPLHALLIQTLHSITFGAYYYLGTVFTAQTIPSEYRASGQAVFAITWGGVSGIAAGAAGGWIYESWGAETMYRSSAVVAVVGAIGFALLRARMGRPAPSEPSPASSSTS